MKVKVKRGSGQTAAKSLRRKGGRAMKSSGRDPFLNVKILGPSANVKRDASVTGAEIDRVIREVAG